MAFRYEELASDMLWRLAHGEWGGVGDQIPSLAQLMNLYDVSGVQTLRNAQAQLVDQGYLLPRHGAGVYIRRLPARADTARVAADRALDTAANAVTEARTQLAILDQAIEDDEHADPPRHWSWARWARCTTCADTDGGTFTSRGWTDPLEDAVGTSEADDYQVIDNYDPMEWHRDQDHDVAGGVGLFPDQDPGYAEAVEAWWEHHAHTDEAVRLLLTGNVHGARAHARRAARIGEQQDFSGWAISPRPVGRPGVGDRVRLTGNDDTVVEGTWDREENGTGRRIPILRLDDGTIERRVSVDLEILVVASTS